MKSPDPQSTNPCRRAFTIVELIIVIAVIGILTGLVVVGIRGAASSGRKLSEQSSMRALGTGWTAAMNTRNGAFPTGFMETDPNPNVSCGPTRLKLGNFDLPWQMCGTYVSQMFTHLDHRTAALWPDNYVTEETFVRKVAENWSPGPLHPPNYLTKLWGLPGTAAALQPAFGYNAYYLGGWIQREGINCKQVFSGANWVDENGTVREGDLTATREVHVKHPDRLIAFCSSSYRPIGNYRHTDATESNSIGCAWVVPPALGQTEVWSVGADDLKGISQDGPGTGTGAPGSGAPVAVNVGMTKVRSEHSVPICRHTRMASVMTVDGAIGTLNIAEMMDMRRWINRAWKADFRHLND